MHARPEVLADFELARLCARAEGQGAGYLLATVCSREESLPNEASRAALLEREPGLWVVMRAFAALHEHSCDTDTAALSWAGLEYTHPDRCTLPPGLRAQIEVMRSALQDHLGDSAAQPQRPPQRARSLLGISLEGVTSWPWRLEPLVTAWAGTVIHRSQTHTYLIHPTRLACEVSARTNPPCASEYRLGRRQPPALAVLELADQLRCEDGQLSLTEALSVAENLLATT